MNTRRSVITGILLFATIAVAGAAAVRYHRTTTAAAPTPTSSEKVTLRFFKNPTHVADFTVQTIDGRTISSARWRGKVTLVNFWATWCPPCRAEIPYLIALQEK